MGFGDADLSQHVNPKITTIGFNAGSVGVEIGKLMLSAFAAARAGQEPPRYRLALDFQSMPRESARRPATRPSAS